MYFLKGLETNVLNILTVASSQESSNAIDSAAVLKAQFVKSQIAQGDGINESWLTENPTHALRFESRPQSVSELLKYFQNEEEDFTKNIPADSNEIQFARLQMAYHELKSQHSNMFSLFDLVFHTVFFHAFPGRGGGSTPRAVGLLWANPPDHWRKPDFMEFFIHELTHNLIFIDERCHQHYTDYEALAKKENYARSTIRNQERRLDLVIHSMAVGIEILSYRHEMQLNPTQTVCVHPANEQLKEACWRSMQSIENIGTLQHLISDRMSDLLSAYKTKLKKMS
ncbi:MAG: hypothetical protein KF799_03205 [Bdellovibrionales bacterium]|nr:hypothetical protein [Bdellovibrionales bacterium]